MKKRQKSKYPNVDVPGSPEYEAFRDALKKIATTPKKEVDKLDAEWKDRKPK